MVSFHDTVFKPRDSVTHVMQGVSVLFDTRVGREIMFSSATLFVFSGTIYARSMQPIK